MEKFFLIESLVTTIQTIEQNSKNNHILLEDCAFQEISTNRMKKIYAYDSSQENLLLQCINSNQGVGTISLLNKDVNSFIKSGDYDLIVGRCKAYLRVKKLNILLAE
ncbi:hypothetical protein ACI6Q2_13550 [Chitinophagaceae bacterium LWZ2-11]